MPDLSENPEYALLLQGVKKHNIPEEWHSPVMGLLAGDGALRASNIHQSRRLFEEVKTNKALADSLLALLEDDNYNQYASELQHRLYAATERLPAKGEHLGRWEG